MNWLLCSDNAGNPQLINMHKIERIWIINDFDGEWSVVAACRVDSYTIGWYSTLEEAIIRLREISNAVASLDIRRQRP